MTKFLVYILCVLVLFGLNIVFPSIRGANPNFLFLLVVFYSFREEGPEFLYLAFFSGLALDFFGSGLFGTYTVSFLLIAVALNYATATFFKSDPTLPFMSVAVIVSYLALFGLVFLINAGAYRLHISQLTVPGFYFARKIWLDLILNLIFAAPIYLLTLLNDNIIDKSNTKMHTPHA